MNLDDLALIISVSSLFFWKNKYTSWKGHFDLALRVFDILHCVLVYTWTLVEVGVVIYRFSVPEVQTKITILRKEVSESV